MDTGHERFWPGYTDAPIVRQAHEVGRHSTAILRNGGSSQLDEGRCGQGRLVQYGERLRQVVLVPSGAQARPPPGPPLGAAL